MTSLPAVPEKGTYKGSCHCGFVTYTVNLDFANPTPQMRGAHATRCNCTICHKSGYLLVDPGKDSAFTLLTPPEGESALSDYSFGHLGLHHPFCPKCGVRCFLKGMYVLDGQEFPVMRINVLTLDGKADGTPMGSLGGLKIMYWDGKSDDWEKDPADEPWQGGVK